MKPVRKASGSRRVVRVLGGSALLAVMLGSTGCAFAPPQPWEKGALSKREMTMESDPLDQRYVQHIYNSKENASGGYGVGGGGCGCN